MFRTTRARPLTYTLINRGVWFNSLHNLLCQLVAVSCSAGVRAASLEIKFTNPISKVCCKINKKFLNASEIFGAMVDCWCPL